MKLSCSVPAVTFAWYLLGLAGGAGAPAASVALPERAFPRPERIRYDAQCLTIDGKDALVFSGAFHYFRCPKELWRDRFRKIKEAGFNCVETYVPWNWSERRAPAGLDDFSQVDLADAEDFLQMAEAFGLNSIVRPGPYICAEWDTGGFPQWLLARQPAQAPREGHWLRGDEPNYLAWCKHWYDAVCPVIARHQITRKKPGEPGVILVQVENEYNFAPFKDEVKRNQIRLLAQTAWRNGIDVPLITCKTAPVLGQTDPVLRQIFECDNFYPRWDVDGIRKALETLRREQPDAPLAITELQGGWFSEVGGQLSEDQDGLTGSQINNLTLFALQNGVTILNYYMLFGGTNPGDWAARDQTTSYDYAAPIREWGGVGDRYQRVRALGSLLREHGVKLARSTPVRCEVAASQSDVTVAMRRASDGGRYLFVRTSQHKAPREGTARIKEQAGAGPEMVFAYALESFGSKILCLPPGVTDAARGQWLPKPAPAIARPAELPPPVALTAAISRADPGPSHWTNWPADGQLAAVGVCDSGFVFYRTQVSIPTATNLLVEFPAGDAVLAEINGELVAEIAGTEASALLPLPAGASDVRLLYENRGHANGGPGLGQPCGLRGARLTGSRFAAGQPISGWRMRVVDGTNQPTELQAGFPDADWKTVAVGGENANQLEPNQTAVFRTGLDLTAADLSSVKAALRFQRIDDRGSVYVNGQKIGEATDYSRSWSFDVTRQAHPGHNTIAVVVQNEGGGGGLGAPVLVLNSDGGTVPIQSFGRPAGDEGQWWSPTLADAGWQPVAIGAPAPPPAPPHEPRRERDGPLTPSLSPSKGERAPKAGEGAVQGSKAPMPSGNSLPALTWYRLKFSLRAPPAGVWVPWRLRLVASGNGFLYLNGHAIGRYWNAGPQHDFFLPECWLQFGSETNTLTLSLRPVNGNAAIQSATIEPCAGFAEQR